MKTRMLTGAFLTYDGEVLAIHRSMNKKIAPGMWAAIGGHIEPHEINDPRAACLREVEEETGIRAASIARLDLRYITIRQTEDEVRISFTFVGELREKCEPAQTNEGTLHWIPIEKLACLPMSVSAKQTALHWLNSGEPARALVGVVDAECRSVTWSEI